MSDRQSISLNDLRRLADGWLAEGKGVAGPVAVKPDLYLYTALQAGEQLALDGFVHAGNSIKEFFFPRHEKIYRYAFQGQDVTLSDETPPEREQIILGARPCDAASLPILDHVFSWDYEDKFYLTRRRATTVVTLGCTESDEQCFCTSVGLGPAAEQGSDVLLLPAGDGRYDVRCLTEKGKALFAGKTKPEDVKTIPLTSPAKRFEMVPLQQWLAENYESPVWKDIAMRCLGCGSCAYSCPTCHCFDIVDEGTPAGGARCKNWDSCQFGMFTMHASGHNPRANQGQRQRQRVQHKFRIYPEKFNTVLCTGCGNCTRNCPVGLGVLTALEEIQQTMQAPAPDAEG